jgi:hypothetical protein
VNGGVAGAWEVVIDLTSALAWPAAAIALAVMAIRFLRHPDPSGTTESELNARVSGWVFRRRLTYEVDRPADVVESAGPRQVGRAVVNEVVELDEQDRDGCREQPTTATRHDSSARHPRSGRP